MHSCPLRQNGIHALVLFWLYFATVFANAQTTYYVNGVCGDNNWTGLSPVCEPPNGPKRRIDTALSLTVSGDTIIVADGLYGGPGHRNMNLAGRLITIRSENGPDNCVLDGQAAGQAFHIRSGEGPEAVIDGLTMFNYDRAILCESSSPTIKNCIFVENFGRDGGAIRCDSSLMTVTNCVFRNNRAGRGGGAIYTTDTGTQITITNCSFTGNRASVLGGALFVNFNSHAVVTNCIFWGDETGRDGPEIALADATIDISYCDVSGGEAGVHQPKGGVNWGAGNLEIDPLWALEDDQHLMPGSPCIDAGTDDPPGGLPPTDIDENPRSLDGDGDLTAVADMGAYEFNPLTASMAVGPDRFEVLATQGRPAPVPETILIRNAGGGTLDWQIESCDWIVLDPPAGSSTGEIDAVSVQIDSDALPLGVSRCNIIVSDPSAANSPRIIRVRVDVGRIRAVPAEYASIQSAIDAAVVGDTVVVADGTYTGESNKNLQMHGKRISVLSEHGPRHCIIDCEGDGRGFNLDSAETEDSIVDGFTIVNGFAPAGAAVQIRSSSPVIKNCILRNNFANAVADAGAAVHCENSDSVFINCLITDNFTITDGGGIACRLGGNPTFLNCTIANNIAERNGGGISVSSDVAATLINTIVWGNTAPTGPQIALLAPSSLNVEYSDVQGGQAAVHVQDGAELNWGPANIDEDPAFAFVLDRHLTRSSPCIDRGLNSALISGIESDLEGSPRVVDGNQSGQATVDIGAFEFNPTVPCIGLSQEFFELSTFEGVVPDDLILFIRNCGGDTLQWQISEPCFWLQADPSTGASNGDVTQSALQFDVSALDIGDFTCDLMVSANGAVNSPRRVRVLLHVGESLRVPSEFATIQAAINAAVAGDAVVLADGVYSGAGNKDLRIGGKAITIISERGPDNCVIDCEGAGRFAEIEQGEGPATVIARITIVNGVGAGAGGIRCRGTSPTIRDCIFRQNGTAISCENGAAPTVAGCILENNTPRGIFCNSSRITLTRTVITGHVAPGHGAGIRLSQADNSIIRNCQIFGNGTETDGGAIHLVSSDSVTISNCFIEDNTAGSRGAAIFAENCMDLVVTNVVLARNTAGTDGGGFYMRGGEGGRAVHCVFSENSAARGGAMFFEDTSLQFANCILWSDQAKIGPEIALLRGNTGAPCEPSFEYCDVQGGQAGASVGNGCTLVWGSGNIETDPGFSAPDDFHLNADSPCVDSGTDDPPGGLVPADIEGTTRPLDGNGDGDAVSDMGAYEFQIGETICDPCDMNCDGDINAFDIEPFLDLLFDPNARPCASCTGDVDGNGAINAFDIEPFLECLFGP